MLPKTVFKTVGASRQKRWKTKKLVLPRARRVRCQLGPEGHCTADIRCQLGREGHCIADILCQLGREGHCTADIRWTGRVIAPLISQRQNKNESQNIPSMSIFVWSDGWVPHITRWGQWTLYPQCMVVRNINISFCKYSIIFFALPDLYLNISVVFSFCHFLYFMSVCVRYSLYQSVFIMVKTGIYHQVT